MPQSEMDGLESLRLKYWDSVKFLEIKPGQIAFFTGTIFHGNIPHKSNSTRVSINLRFKSIFSPEQSRELSERGVGTFYKVLCVSPITELAVEYSKRVIIF